MSVISDMSMRAAHWLHYIGRATEYSPAFSYLIAPQRIILSFRTFVVADLLVDQQMISRAQSRNKMQIFPKLALVAALLLAVTCRQVTKADNATTTEGKYPYF